MKHREGRPGVLAGLVGVWLVACVLGTGLLWRYASAAGERAAPPGKLPESLGLERGASDWALLIFLHPQCACSRATLTELGKLVHFAGARLATRVYIWAPREASEGFVQSELWERSRALPGVEVLADVDGKVARELGALTSGHVVLYAPDGTERFSGGITAARGHEGDSPGGLALRALLSSGEAERSASPVFGCALNTPSQVTGVSPR
ncbi:RedB protein [Myxococcus sp. K38C18041901]|uniref:RedB protein n=1 Tax=Myxococcus guangdongensis TaxID=2906760 RepID=UPI0020A80B86|nr:RedB protein [Myxococcus guangdongensis]MCP3061810.1 RedB protein [Myxococcus guangdongensis]